MRTPADIATSLDNLANELRASSHAGGWVDAHYRDHDIRSTDEIAYICECSPDTVRRRAINAAAAGQPLGIMVAGVHLLSLHRVFAWLEDNIDLHARRRAESRAPENANLRPRPQNRLEIVPDAALTAS
jgi:hypothetical protein